MIIGIFEDHQKNLVTSRQQSMQEATTKMATAEPDMLSNENIGLKKAEQFLKKEMVLKTSNKATRKHH